MNFAVIGTFWLTENMIAAIERTDGAVYFAQYSRSIDRAREFAQKHGKNVRIYDDLDALAKDSDIDAVYIASPNYAHYPQAKKMLSAGKSVLCEKPICYTKAEYLELCELADRQGVVFMEAIINVHLPWAVDVKNTLSGFGKIISARLDFSQRSSKLERVKNGEHFSTFERSTGGGALMDLGVYAIYLAFYLFGKPMKMHSDAHFFSSGVDIQDVVTLSYDDFTAVLTFTKLAESRVHSEILCENGALTIENLSRLQGVIACSEQSESIQIHADTSFPDAMCFELSDFISYHGKGESDYQRYRVLACEVLDIMESVRAQIGYEI